MTDCFSLHTLQFHLLLFFTYGNKINITFGLLDMDVVVQLYLVDLKSLARVATQHHEYLYHILSLWRASGKGGSGVS